MRPGRALAEHIILPYLWKRYLNALRVAAGGACLWFTLLPYGRGAQIWIALTIAVMLLSAIEIFQRPPDWVTRVTRRVVHAPDILFFVLNLALGPPDGFWVAAFSAFSLLLALATLRPWPWVLLGTLFAIGVTYFFNPRYAGDLLPILILLGGFAVVLSLQKKTLMERLANSLRTSLYYRSTAKQAQAAERNRIAADFHDGPLQSIISFQMRLEVLRRMLDRDPERGLVELRRMQRLFQEQITEVRTFIRNMRPPDVDGAGMASALRREVNRFEKDTGIAASFEADVSASNDDLDAHMDVVQILREALNNVQKHSSASQVLVNLSRDNGQLQLHIRDDGRGFPFSGTYSLEQLDRLAIGPESIVRRVKSLHGELTLHSEPGAGAELTIRVPAA